MTITFTWEALAAIAAILTVICSAFALYVQYALRVAIAELVDKLDQRYVPLARCQDRHAEHERRINAIEERA